jgi:hypothetical protein
VTMSGRAAKYVERRRERKNTARAPQGCERVFVAPLNSRMMTRFGLWPAVAPARCYSRCLTIFVTVASSGFCHHQQRGIGINLDHNGARPVLGAERFQFTANHMNTLGGFDAQRHAVTGNTLHDKRDVFSDHDPFSNFPA